MATQYQNLVIKRDSIINNYMHNIDKILKVNNSSIYNIHSHYEGEKNLTSPNFDDALKSFNDGNFLSFLQYVNSKQKAISRLLKTIYESSEFYKNVNINNVANKKTNEKNDNIENVYKNSDKSSILYKGEQENNYKQKISRFNDKINYEQKFTTTESFPGSKPSDVDVKNAAKEGFNLGQILGPSFGISNNNNSYLASNNINVVLYGIKNGKFSFQDFLNIASKNSFTSLGDTNSGIYNPSFLAPPKPTPEKIPLAVLLEQNLLMPKNNANSNSVFNDTYISNRGKIIDNIHLKNLSRAEADTIMKRFSNEGIVGGVPVGSLQEPDENGLKLFDFSNDPNIDDIERGFNSNVNVNDTNRNTRISNSVVYIKNESNRDSEVDNAKENQYFPFLFETENKQRNEICYFQAAIDSLNETPSPSWNKTAYVGRSEEVHTYINTDRSIDINFSIYATSMRRLGNIYERINWLMQQTYPEYASDVNDANGFNRIINGPIIRMTLGDIYNGVPGYIRSLSFDFNKGGNGGRWEITPGIRMPQILSVNMSFQVLHDNMPNRNANFYPGLNYIVSGNGLMLNNNGRTYLEQISNNIV